MVNGMWFLCLSLPDSADCFVVAGARLFSVMSLSFAPEVSGWAVYFFPWPFESSCSICSFLMAVIVAWVLSPTVSWDNAELMWWFDWRNDTASMTWFSSLLLMRKMGFSSCNALNVCFICKRDKRGNAESAWKCWMVEVVQWRIIDISGPQAPSEWGAITGLELFTGFQRR